ncbi:MAG: hypothetical protein FWC62_09075 [Firmicutes bacterium]|nr:hypothetical protein [Bacillota bacterium]
MDLDAIQKIAYDLMATKRSHPFKEKGNKYYHGQRVGKLALTLRNLIFPGDGSHDAVLVAAAWFHDISNGEAGHARKGAEVTKEVLTPYCTAEELSEICGIICVHDDRQPEKPLPDCVKIHQDADLLDHFGTFDIWSTFLYGVSHSETITDTANIYRNVRPTEYEEYRNQLNFEVSKKIYDEKYEFMRRFGDRFAAESDGEIWGLESILIEE